MTFRKLYQANSVSRLPKKLAGRISLTGTTGSGKNYFLQHFIKSNNLSKILFIGRIYDYNNYLTDGLEFKKYNINSNIALMDKLIFIESSFHDMINFSVEIVNKFTTIVKQALQKGYIVIFDDIYGDEDKYHKLVDDIILNSTENDNFISIRNSLEEHKHIIEYFESYIVMKDNRYESTRMLQKDFHIESFAIGDYIYFKKSYL